MAASLQKLANVSRVLSFSGIRRATKTGAPLVCSQPNRSRSTALPKAAYGGRHTVTVLPGDGTGPELMAHVREVFRYAGAPIDFEEVQIDETVTDENELENALLAIKRNGVAIKGNINTNYRDPATGGSKSRNVELRSELELFANVVWCRSIPGVDTRHKDIDLVVIRENTEGEYRQLEHENVDGVIESLKIITEVNSTRIAEYAFDFAERHGRRKVTAVHKANIMKLGDGLFLECCEKVSKKYPDIEFEAMIVDNCSMQMVSKPQQFDVLVLPNLYGMIIANIGVGLVGGAGVVAGANIGSDYAVFEPGTRNTGKKIAGKNIVNPTAMLLAGSDMLDYLGLTAHASIIRDSVMKVVSEERIHTPDLGGQATTTEMIQAIIKDIQTKTSTCFGL